MKWPEELKGRVKFNEPLSCHTSFKIGGEAKVLFEPKDIDDLVKCLALARKEKIPYFVIGNGTNILISDKGFGGIVIKLSSLFFRKINIKENIVTVGSGVLLADLIKFLSNTDLTGYEFLAGIPASVGGALVMNAGTNIDNKRHNTADITYKVKVINKKCEIINLSNNECGFGYRKSNLGKFIIIEAQLKLNKINHLNQPDNKNRIKEYLEKRDFKLDLSKPNAGCIFKNPSENLSAGALIDRCSLKGLRLGGAMVSNKHANFILNFDKATFQDVVELISIVKERVHNNFGIKLKEEIKIVY